MSSRRIEKIDRFIQQTVSEVIQTRLSDPRIRGLVSVTRVQTSADLRCAAVYLSVMGVDEKKQEQSVRAIRHAGGYIQAYLAEQLATRVCPTLNFQWDRAFQRSLELMRLLDQVAAERAQQEQASGVPAATEAAKPDDEG